MKSIFALSLFFIFAYNSYSIKGIVADQNLEKRQISNDSLFQLDFLEAGNVVQINSPKHSDFYLPNDDTELKPFKLADFNNDGKEDILINLGECGTGGCMFGLFLNQFDNYYTLAYSDYLKNPDFKEDKNGKIVILSSEEINPYDPSKLSISIFKFNSNSEQYEKDTTYIE